MKKIRFLSFGHWSNYPAYKTSIAGDTLLQSIDQAVAAEEIGWAITNHVQLIPLTKKLTTYQIKTYI